jgi:nucleoside-diphosphate-sugar epimerase
MRLFVFGLGYTGLALARGHRSAFAWIGGTVREAARAEALASEGIHARLFGDGGADPVVTADLARSDAILISIPPSGADDPVLVRMATAIAAAPASCWIGYLSTVGVYGDRGGAFVDETTPPAPVSERSRERLAAEEAWLDFGRRSGRAVHLFRLAGIYGPGRNALARVADGTARRIVKPGQVFNRIHVDDIAAVLVNSAGKPRAGAVYNLADDEPAPPQDVIAYAARLAGVKPPPEIPFESARLGEGAASFYAENKRVSNRLLKDELGIRLLYPSYRVGLEALWRAGEGRNQTSPDGP